VEEQERDLDGWREAIDRLDRQIVALLEERAEVARQIGKLKAARGEPVYVPAREQAVLERVIASSRGDLIGMPGRAATAAGRVFWPVRQLHAPGSAHPLR
jgi:chorismate mutase